MTPFLDLPLPASLGSRLNHALRPILAGDPLFVTDSPELCQWLQQQECASLEMSDLDTLLQGQQAHPSVVLLPTQDYSMRFAVLHQVFQHSRMLIVPLVAFDPDFEAAKYTLEMMARSNFTEAVQQNQKWLNLLQSTGETLVFRGGGTEISCSLKEHIQLMYPRTRVELAAGEWEAIGPFFEVAMIPDNEDIFHPGYLINGVLEADGIAIAHHRHMPEQFVPFHAQAWNLFQRLRKEGKFPVRLEVQDSRVTRIVAKDEDITAQVRQFSGESLELILVEMALANNPSLTPEEILWEHNTVMNEGLRGIHVAVGDGVIGAHIDFICQGVEVCDR